MTDLPLTEAEIAGALADSPFTPQGDTIVAEVELDDFAAVITAVNAIAAVAEAQNHHPDLLIHGWNHLRVTLSTHSAGQVTGLDLKLAASIGPLL
jgi:4a-hydroxytetrahydrobiopterin dehydratase